MKKVVIWLVSLFLLPLKILHSLEFEQAKQAEQADSQRHIVLIIRNDFYGERECAYRMKLAAEHLHWTAKICDNTSSLDPDDQYNWMLTLVPGISLPCSVPNHYLVLYHPTYHYFDLNGHLKQEYLPYDGYLATYQETEILLQDVQDHKKHLYPKPWYPTVHYRPYRKVMPTRLFYFVGTWGDRLFHTRYQTLQRMLAEQKYTNFFGHPACGIKYGNTYKGFIPCDGESSINCISEMGVCLVLHSKGHLQHAVPSGRIFEAAAASAVIISDRNPFVMKHFGDSVLYINEECSGEECFKQIDSCMMWIRKHPQKALEMAKKAHQIFEEHFLLEQQLLDFDKFFTDLH